MITDRPPRKSSSLTEFMASDQRLQVAVPRDDRLRARTVAIESAMRIAKPAAVLHACADFLTVGADFYQVQRPGVRVLAARPLRVREGGWSSELFGDYNLETMLIRVWTKTAVRKQVTSFGTFFSTLCHEFCHHLDCRSFGYRGSPHTRGFYQRAAALYHHSRGTDTKQLVWIPVPRGRWRIDWRRINRAAPTKSFSTSA
jgi:hypothetical protein